MPAMHNVDNFPSEESSNGGNGWWMLLHFSLGCAVGVIVGAVGNAIDTSMSTAKNEKEIRFTQKKLEEYTAASQKRVEELAQSIKFIEEKLKKQESLHPPAPPGKAYIKCKDVQKFTFYCFKEQFSDYYDECRPYMKALSLCPKKKDA